MRGFFAGVLLCLWFIPVLVLGESSKRSHPKIPEKIFINAAQQVRIPPESKFYPNIVKMIVRNHELDWRLEKNAKEIEENRLKALTGETEDMVPEQMPPRDLTPTEQSLSMEIPRPTRHIRSNKGISFTDKEEMMRLIRPTINSSIEELQTNIVKASKSLDQKIKDRKPYLTPQLTACKESLTEKKVISKSNKGNQQTFDMLFISDKVKPRDPDEYFGVNTFIRPYKAGSEDYQSLASLGLGIKCLPARIRGVGGVRYFHQGKDALKNYDADPGGEGELHYLIKEELSEYMQP